MNIVIDICLAWFFNWLIRQLKDKKIIIGIVTALLSVIMLLLMMCYSEKLLVDYGISAAAFALIFIFYKRLASLASIINKGFDRSDKAVIDFFKTDDNDSDGDVDDISEDFMKTKQGKILTAICVLLVIYMIGSAFAIYKLNAKINSVYQITQEMTE